MYLSRIPLNPLRRHTRRLLQSPQRIHAEVLGSLPPTVTGRTLWREEIRRLPSGGVECNLVVLTPRPPSWHKLVEDAGWPATPEGEPLVRSLAPLLDRLAVGREFGFRVRANPTHSLRSPGDGDRPRGRRHGHTTVEHQMWWFVERATRSCRSCIRWGFELADAELPSLSVVARERTVFTKATGEPRRVTLNRVTYAGRLRVVDVDTLRETLLGGLGGAKAYGCGLLTLASANGIE